MKWEDATSYSRDGDRTPTAWRLSLAGLHIAVASNHRWSPGNWVMHCAPWFDTHDLGMPVNQFSKEQAQEKALKLVRARVQKIVDALEAAP
jgi:hypothetical protein